MATPKEVEKLIEERDGALKSLADKTDELVTFQRAALEREAALKAACPPPESGVSLNVSFTINTDGTILTGGQLTLRADRYTDTPALLSAFRECVKESNWKVAPAPKSAPAAKENKAVAILKESGATPEVIAAAKQATAHVKEMLMVNSVFMNVEPKAGGKVNVNFFGNDHKQPHNQFADIYVTRSAEQLAKDMPFLNSEVFDKAGEYTCNLVIGYTLSDKLNSKGNPYKDVQYIRQAAA